MHRNARLLIKPHHKNSKSAFAALRAYSFMKGMRDGKGPITSSALNKMMNKFEVTGSLALCPRSGRTSATAAVATTVQRWCNLCLQFLHKGSAIPEKFQGRQECRMEVSGEHCE